MKTNPSFPLRCWAVRACAFVLCLGSLPLAIGADINPVLVGSWPEYPRGYASAVAVAGNRALVACGPGGLVILDISDPTQPRRLGSYHRGSDSLAQVAIGGNYAYVHNSKPEVGLEIIDISNPASPRRVGTYQVPGGVNDVTISGTLLYVASFEGLSILDISKPAAPQRVGYLTNLMTYSVTVSGNIAFVSGIWSPSPWAEVKGGQVIDVSDPARPQSVGEFAATGFGNGVAMSGTKVYVSTADGLTVLDISDPANPQRIAALTGFFPYTLAVSSNLLVVSAPWSTPTGLVEGLRVIDVTDPASPQPLAILHTGRFSTFEIALSGNYAYTVDGRGFHVVDLSDPRIPKRVGGYAIGQIMASALSGNHAYVADGWAGLQVLDISDPARPSRAGGYANGRFAQVVAVNGPHAYVLSADETWWNSGFQLNVINVDDPSNPRSVGDLTILGSVLIPSLAVSGRYAYVASFWGDLHVIDLSDPAKPLEVGRYSPYSIAQMAVSGDHAFVIVDYNEGGRLIEVINLSNPVEPRYVGRYPVHGSDQDLREGFGRIAASGMRVYLLGTYFDVLDFSNPTEPRRIGRYSERHDSSRFVVSGNYAFLAGEYGVQVIDVSDPTRMSRIGGATIGEAWEQVLVEDIVVRLGKVLVTTSDRGLAIFQMPPFIKSISKDGSNVKLEWEGFGPTRLQRATRLTNPDWQDLIGSENTNRVTLPMWGGPEFFRLVRP